MKYFPNSFAQTVRMAVFCLVLTRGALELRFHGMGPILLLLPVFPGIFEALIAS